jgi:hypothetical protein
MKNKKSRNKSIREPLGHGDHWQAIFPRWNSHPEKTQQFITRLCKEATPRAKFLTPWPRPELDFNVIIRLAYESPHFETAVLLGISPSNKTLNFLSTYPVLAGRNIWQLKPAQISDAYGPFEGFISFELPSGACINCFSTHFGEEKERWENAKKPVPVQMTALALELKRFDAKPIRVDAGPLLEETRKELRDEGKHEEADALDHVMLSTDEMRTLYCEDTDHASMVGRITGLKKLERVDIFPPGYQLEVEVLPDYDQGWRNITVFAYLPSLGAYTPKKGDLVQGVVWLQGKLH